MSKISSQKGAVEISTFAGLAIIAAVVVVISTIAVIKYRETPRVIAPVAVISPKATLNINTTPSLIPVVADQAANWQTYKNEEFGFEFKYPLDFIEQKSESNVTSFSATKEDRGSSYYLGMYIKPNYKVDQIISTIVEAEKIVVGGNSGYKYFYIEGAGMSEIALIQVGQDALSIGFNIVGSGQNFAIGTGNDRKIYVQDFLDQVLSTLKFTR